MDAATAAPATKTVPEGYQRTEVGLIPEDWEEKSLEEMGNTYNGLSGKRGADFGDGNHSYIPFLNVMNNSVIDTSNFDTVKIKAGESQSTVEKGDLLFNTSSETPEEVGMCSVLLDGVEDLHLNSFCFGFRLFGEDEFVPLFLVYYFRSQYGREHMKALAQGSTRYNLSKSKFIRIKLALPPYKEQRAIAGALSDVDALIAELDVLIQKKQQIKKGAMQQLLTGKKRLPGFSGAWEEKKLEEIGNTYNGLSGKRGADFGDGNHPYIPFLNVMNNPVIDISRFDSVKIKAGESQSTAVKGDLFFNTSSETPEEVGMCSVLLEEIENLHLNSFCFGFRLFKEDEVVPQFLAYYFRSQYGREHMKALAQGSTRYNLSKSKFIKIEVALPSYEEQKAIAQILRDMDAEIQALESKRDKYKQIKQGMMQELLTGKTRLV
jgi:type I restriction enzyme S subunit